MPKTKTTLLITGSSGFVGSHFAKYFSKANWRVVGLDMVPPPGALEEHLHANLIGDIADTSKVSAYCKEHHVGAVIHCAAKCLVAESVENPDLYEDYNLRRATKLVDTLQSLNIKHFLFSSTAAVYGSPKKVPIPEDAPKKPINPYGQTKLSFENELLKRSKEKSLVVGICRYFNAAGADPEGFLKESHVPETHLIPNAIRAAMGQNPVFSLFGTDYQTRDGTAERDYIHVWDLANAHAKLLLRMLRENEGGVYNLGTGKGFTVEEVLSEIESQVQRKIPIRREERRLGDPPVLVADPRRAKDELDWKPRFSSLPLIVQHALAPYFT